LSINRAFAVARRELEFLSHSPWDFFATFGTPVILVVVLLAIFANGTPRGLPIAVVDEDHSATSRGFVESLGADPVLSVAVEPPALSEALVALHRSSVEAIIVIPTGSDRHLRSGKQARISAYLDALHSVSASLIGTQLQTVFGTSSVTIAVVARAKHRTPASEGLAESEAIAVDARTLYNPRVDYERYLGTTLIPAALGLALTLAIVAAFGRELRDGTASEWLVISGDDIIVALVGKATPYVTTFSIFACAAIAIIARAQGLTFGLVLTYVATVVFCAAIAAFAVAILGATGQMKTAMSLASFWIAPAFAFSGVSFPQQNLFTQIWSEAIPLTPYLRLQINELQLHLPAAAALPDLADLCVFLLLGSALSLFTMSSLLRTTEEPHPA
jgi:ABC-2 type transport system permease protein